MSMLPQVLRTALVSSAVFDHPERSPRGRLITSAFHFRMQKSQLPEVAAADDAKEAFWWPVERLEELETECFEDHWIILDHFLMPA